MQERFTVAAPALGVHVTVEFERAHATRVQLTRAPPEDADAAPLSAAAESARALVEAHVVSGAADLARVPVDFAGVAPFHREVLTLLREVPAGATVTYGDLAKRLGKPGASRAVGGAMRANPLPFIVPCHRVVQADGSLGHYSGEGGAATKRLLLALERAPGFAPRTLDSFA